MSQRLSLADSRVIFDELAQALPKQHLRFQFRKRFGTGELLGPEMLKRGTTASPRERPLSNLLQETPPTATCIRITGSVDEPKAEKWTLASLGTVGELFSSEEVEQCLVVHGRTAKLYIYGDPTEDTVFVLRIGVEAPVEEKVKPKPPRRVRAAGNAKAGKAFARHGRRR